MSCRHEKKRREAVNVRNVSPNRGDVLGEDEVVYWGNACCPFFPSYDDDYGNDD